MKSLSPLAFQFFYKNIIHMLLNSCYLVTYMYIVVDIFFIQLKAIRNNSYQNIVKLQLIYLLLFESIVMMKTNKKNIYIILHINFSYPSYNRMGDESQNKKNNSLSLSIPSYSFKS